MAFLELHLMSFQRALCIFSRFVFTYLCSTPSIPLLVFFRTGVAQKQIAVYLAEEVTD